MNKPALQTYQVSIRIAQVEWEVYAEAFTPEDAVEDVRADLPLQQRRWARIFVG